MNATAGKNGLARPALGKVLALDALFLATGVIVAWCLDATTAWSILLGGLTFLLPQAWFGWRAFRARGAVAAREVAQGFYRAEAGKFLLVTAGFALSFSAAGPVDPLWLIVAYVVMLLLNSVLLALTRAV
jgi:ATP synthase protein I